MKPGRGILRRALIVAVLGACALAPATATAGSYDVYSCKVGSAFYGNNAWTASNNPNGGTATRFTADTTCTSPGDVLNAALQPSVQYPIGSYAALSFVSPPNTKIADYIVTLRQIYSAAGLASDPNTPFVMTTFGPYAFTLAGNYDAGPINYVTQDGHYWGAAGPIDKTITLSKADSPHSSVLQGTAPSMSIFAGCWAGRAAVCSLGASDLVQTQIIGSRITVEDDLPPDIAAVQAGQGLLAAGVRSGAEPITFSASDGSGIRRAQIVDVTDTANQSVVASEDYNTGPDTDVGTRCDYTRPRPCPDVKNETIAAPTPIAGHRTLLLRVTDAGGESAVSAPFSVYARGPLNGVNGGDGARLVAGFPAKVFRGKGRKRHAVFVLRPSRTVSYGKGAIVRGTLKSAGGQPVAAADVRILVRDARLGAQYADRGGVTTGADGRFQFSVPAGSSRLLRLGYRAYKGDDAFVARSTSTLNTRARIRVRGPRRVRPRGVAKFSGRLVGRPVPPRGVTLDLQIFQPGVGWRVFATARTRKSGTFTVRYHFQRASTGRFTFRIRLRPNDAYPYARGFSGRIRVRVG
ncbi:MAG TPA: carboxypeptidase-like regulatory domain-containing protein [Solirubrobacteraceae bacterium]